MVTLSVLPAVFTVGVFLLVVFALSQNWALASTCLVGVFLCVYIWLAEPKTLCWGLGTWDVALVQGFVLVMIFSEAMLFLAWVFTEVFYADAEWAAYSVSAEFWGVPVLISVVLLSSGVSVLCAHLGLIQNASNSVWWVVTGLLGVLFVAVQTLEWCSCGFVLESGLGGSLFYLITGFHGAHVFIGTVLLMGCFAHSLGGMSSAVALAIKEGVIWYWHFVDVVWLFVLTSVYWYSM